MINYWPLLGIIVIILGLVLKQNTVLVVLISGIITGIAAHLGIYEILVALGKAFTTNRYMSLFILTLPLIGIAERFGLRQQAERVVSKIKAATPGKIMALYMLFRQITVGLGIQIGGHPQMIRPLVQPMADAALREKTQDHPTAKQTEKVKGLSATSENLGNFFGQLLFIASPGLLLIKGIFSGQHYTLSLAKMALWALPVAVLALIFAIITFWLFDRRLK